MPFKFSTFCSLLSDLEDIELHDPPLIKPQKTRRIACAVEDWFRSHRTAIDALSVDGASALLSAFFPEWRTDRVYGLQAAGLCRTVGRLLSLGGARLKDLQAYREPRRGDLAECVERVQRSGGARAYPALSLEEVDEMLQNQASRSKFSDRSVPSSSVEERNRALGGILFRASPSESKWLIRLLLKDLSPVRIDQDLTLKYFHFLLPDLLRFQHDFRAAMAQLRGPLSKFPARPDTRSEQDYREGAAVKLRPQIGVKVGRPEFQKCRGIDHCMKLVQNKQWVLERKYDGEYCEIHIDLTRSAQQWVKIYSKSGKDSTEDRQALHSTLFDCLRLGKPDCKIKSRAILVGELVVYSDQDEAILPFEIIRKHVKRSGQFIGTASDSQPSPHEHLAIVFFDLLLWDDVLVMAKSIEQRRLLLRRIYVKRHGRAMGAEWKILDFGEGEPAKRRFIEQFAASNAQRCEGLILKPMGLPYFPLGSASYSRRQCIKLKKDYINGLADEADFALVGAGYNAQAGLRRGVANLKWTSFHLACLTNKEDVIRFDEKPNFRYVASIEDESCIPLPILTTINSIGPFVARDAASDNAAQAFNLDVPRTVRFDTVFVVPFVIEVIGSDFVKPSNCNYFMLRHPRAKKLHEDRSWKVSTSFQELQEQAAAARLAPTDSESQETRRWIEKLERSCRRKFDREKIASTRLETSTPETGSSSSVAISPLHARVVKRVPELNIDSVGRKAKVRRILPGPKHVGTATPTASGLDSSPLKEITNKSQARLNNVSTMKTPASLKITKTRDTPSLNPETNLKCRADCLFASAAILLAPCIRNYLYVCDDLLSTHDISMVDEIGHWDRDSFSRPPHVDTVSESQAYPGLRKIVLVEGRRPTAVLDMMEKIRRLNNGCLRERIEIYDWRVLEDCKLHDKGAEGAGCHLIGAALYDDTLQRAVLASDLRQTRGLAHD